MKDSIAYLPKDKQEELNFLVTEILRRLPQTEFIILYGSYARVIMFAVAYELKTAVFLPLKSQIMTST